MQGDKNSLAKWIVKSENKILGPYSFEQIEDLVRKKQISLIDEVRDSSTRWLYVRENPEFKSIVESIRKELDSKLESTKTFQSFSKTEELASKTKTDVSAQIESEEAPEVKEISVVKEILQNHKEERRQLFQEDLTKREKVKLYGLANDAVVQQKVKTSGFRFLIYIGIFFILALGGVGGFYYYEKASQQKQEELWSQQIKKYKFLGLDQKAVEVFGKMPQALQKKTLPQVIELLPLLETNGSIRSNEIENLKNTENLSSEQKANLNLVQFWSAMQGQNYDLAQDFVVKAQTLFPASKLVKENDAIVNFKKGRFQKSLDIYTDLYKGESSGRYLFGMVLAAMGLSSGERAKYIPEISQTIEKYTYVYYDYKKELLLAQMVFAKQDKNDSLFQKTWKQFINTPCQLSALFKKPLLLGPSIYLWKDLSELIAQLRPHLNAEEAVIFETHQLLESGQISAASEYIAQNAAKIKDNFVKQQLNLLIFHFQSRGSDVIALEKANQLDMQSELNHVVLALNKLETNPNSDISAHVQYFNANKMDFYRDWISLVQLMKQGSTDALRTFTRNHFLTVNNFIPALEAKSLVE